MHYITQVEHESDFRLRLRFEDGSLRRVDLADHLDGEVFEPLKEAVHFQTARLNADLDTVVWDNGADMSPDFLYEISTQIDDQSALKIAEGQSVYGGGEAIRK